MSSAAPAFLGDVSKGANLKHVDAPKESLASVQAKVQIGIKKGAAGLKKVDAPSTELTDAQKKAYLEDKAAKAK